MVLVAMRFAFENEDGGSALAIGLIASVRMMARLVMRGCLVLGIVLSCAPAFWEFRAAPKAITGIFSSFGEPEYH